MSRLTRRGATSATILLWVALCLVGFAVVAVWTVQTKAAPMQADIERRARDAVSGGPGLNVRVEADGRDVTVHGRVGNEADHLAVITNLMGVEGIRRIDDALLIVPGLPTHATAASEGWGDALAVPAEPSPAPAAPGAAPPASGDAWGTNRPVEATPTAATKRTKRTKRTRTATAAAKTASSRTPTRRSRRKGAVLAQDQLVFSAGSAGLSAAGRTAIRAMAGRAAAGGTVHVYGHADDGGSEWANHDLSLDRANGVARALRGAGVTSVSVHGAGDQYPLGPVGSLPNRRVELALHGSGQ